MGTVAQPVPEIPPWPNPPPPLFRSAVLAGFRAVADLGKDFPPRGAPRGRRRSPLAARKVKISGGNIRKSCSVLPSWRGGQHPHRHATPEPCCRSRNAKDGTAHRPGRIPGALGYALHQVGGFVRRGPGTDGVKWLSRVVDDVGPGSTGKLGEIHQLPGSRVLRRSQITGNARESPLRPQFHDSHYILPFISS